jgi:hypothetical protein
LQVSLTARATRLRRLAKKLRLGLMAVGGALTGALAFGIMDFLYHPEFFRHGIKPRPSREIAPGEAEITPRIMRAGRRRETVTLRFRCGPGGISEGGGIKIGLCRLVDFGSKGRRAVFLYGHGWGPWQNRYARMLNYYRCEVRTSGAARLEVSPQGFFPWRGALRFLGRETLRRMGSKLEALDIFYLFMEQRKIRIQVRDDRLQEGDEIIVVLGDTDQGGGGWASPAHPSRADLAVEVDEKAMGQYRFISSIPVLEVTGGEAISLQAVLSSVPAGGEGRLFLRAVDGRGDLDSTFTGEVALSPTPGLEIPSKVELEAGDRGVVQVACCAMEAGMHKVTASGEGLSAESNPVLAGDAKDMRLYWGDIHMHSALCDGSLAPAELYRIVRDELGLDFAALTTHDTMQLFEPSGREDEWIILRELQEEFNQPGRFVTFLGYEWSDHKHGHRGIFFAPGEKDPRMYGWLDPASDTPSKLEAVLADHQVLVIPHHTAWRRIFMTPFNWSKFLRMRVPEAYTWWGPGSEQQRLVEVYSMHGSSERYDGPFPITHGRPQGFFPRFLADDRSRPGHGNYVQEALCSGLRLGMIAGSDRHDYAADERIHPVDIYTGGLTAIWAEDLTAESLWSSLYARRVYGTSGARIVLEFYADGMPMGAELTCRSHPRLSGRIVGTAPLERVEIIRHDQRGYTTAWTMPGDGGKEAAFDFEDDRSLGQVFYYLRVEQQDGHWAWSSPIWVMR